MARKKKSEQPLKGEEIKLEEQSEKDAKKELFVDISREHIESDHSIRIRRDGKEFVEVEVWNNNDGLFLGAKTVEQILTENGASFREDSEKKRIARIHFSPHNGEISHIEQVNN